MWYNYGALLKKPSLKSGNRVNNGLLFSSISVTGKINSPSFTIAFPHPERARRNTGTLLQCCTQHIFSLRGRKRRIPKDNNFFKKNTLFLSKYTYFIHKWIDNSHVPFYQPVNCKKTCQEMRYFPV